MLNSAYTASLNAIGAATGPSYIVAGFTEVLNSDPVLRVTIANLAQTLDPGLTGLVVIEVGTTAVGVRREYIAITWNPEYVTVQHAGQVLWNAAAQTWQAHNTAAAEVVDNRIPLPAGPPLGADTRGLAYIAATYAGANFSSASCTTCITWATSRRRSPIWAPWPTTRARRSAATTPAPK